jgi:hypothetical protein
MPFQVVNPMAEMQTGVDRARANRLAQIQEADIVRARQEEQLLNQLYQQAYNPQTGQIDANKLYGGMASNYMGRNIPKAQAAEAELMAKRATAAKTTSEVPKQIWENARNELSLIDVKNDDDAQARYQAWGTRLIQQAPWAANYLPSTLDEASQQRLLTTADKAIENHFVSQDLGGSTRVLTMPKYGTGEAQVVPGTEATVTESPNRPKTTVVTQSETERAKTLGKLSGEDVMARYKNVQSSVRGLQKSNEALDLLKQGKPVTGLGADLELGISRLRKAVAGRPDKSISDTELLEAVLGQDVFQQIQQLGIGARGLDTPAEREFLRAVVSGTKTLDKQTLIKMAEARRNAQEDIVRSWNEDTKSGDLDSFYRDTGYRKKEYALPERKAEARQLSPQDQEALDWANSNPRDPRAAKIKMRLEGK